MVKRLPAMRETRVRSLGWEDLLEKETATHSSTLAWKIPQMEEPDRLQSMGSQRVGHDWATSLSLYILYALVIANTLFQQHKRRLQTWTSPDGHYRDQINYILCSQRWRSSIQSAKTRPGADCGSDHEFLIGKFRLKLKKVGKTTRPFRYDLNQIPYDYTAEVRNWFKGLDLINRVPDELSFMTLYRRQGSRWSPRKRNAKKQNGCLRRAYK